MRQYLLLEGTLSIEPDHGQHHQQRGPPEQVRASAAEFGQSRPFGSPLQHHQDHQRDPSRDRQRKQCQQQQRQQDDRSDHSRLKHSRSP
jgi:hypothetical protein